MAYARSCVKTSSPPPPGTRPKPTSGRPSARPSSGRPNANVPSKPPRRLEERLDEALADAEKMARRVERVDETDPFAATLLAAEYLGRVQERDVNPLEQRGQTEAWTSAFVRLRVMADRAARQPDFERKGKLYLAARAEERRLDLLLGPDARTTLSKARDRVRAARKRRVLLRTVSGLALVGAAAFAISIRWDVPRIVAGCSAAASLLAAIGLFFRAVTIGAAIRRELLDVTFIERGMTERASFEVSPIGRGLLRELQEKHPLLVKAGLAAKSSMPPPSERAPHMSPK